MDQIGQAIQTARAERGVTLEQAAFCIGVSPQKLSDWESGLALPPRPDIPAIVRWLGKSPFAVPADLAGRLQVCSLLLGQTAKQLAAEVDIPTATFKGWLKGQTFPRPSFFPRLTKLLVRAGLSLPDQASLKIPTGK